MLVFIRLVSSDSCNQNTLKENKSLKECCERNLIRRPCFILGVTRTGTFILSVFVAALT